MNKYRSISNPTLVIETPLRSIISNVKKSNERLQSMTKILKSQTDRLSIDQYLLDQQHPEKYRYQSQPKSQQIPSDYQHHLQQQYIFKYPQNQQQLRQQSIPHYFQIPPQQPNRMTQFSNVFQMMMLIKELKKTPKQKKRKPSSPEQSSSESSIMKPIQSQKRILMVRPKRKQLTPIIQQPIFQQAQQQSNQIRNNVQQQSNLVRSNVQSQNNPLRNNVQSQNNLIRNNVQQQENNLQLIRNNLQNNLQRNNDRLKLLQSQRGKLNLIKLKNAFWYVFRFRKCMSSLIEERKQEVKTIMPDLIKSFMVTTEQWMRRVTQNIVEQIPRINVDIMDKNISKSQMEKRIISLREIIKNILAALVNDCVMPQTTMRFLSIYMHNYSHMPDNYLIKYELDRLEYSIHGALKNISRQQQHMLFVTNILIRILIYRVLARIGHEQKMKIICSVLYDIFMLSINTKPIYSNMKHIQIAFKIKERQPSYYLLENFEIHKEAIERLQMNQPLLHPLFENLMENLSVQMVQQFCQNVENKVNDYYQMKHQEEIKIKRSLNKYSLKASIQQLIYVRKQNYRAISAEIESLK